MDPARTVHGQDEIPDSPKHILLKATAAKPLPGPPKYPTIVAFISTERAAYHTIPYHTIPDQTIPDHTILYHIIMGYSLATFLRPR